LEATTLSFAKKGALKSECVFCIQLGGCSETNLSETWKKTLMFIGQVDMPLGNVWCKTTNNGTKKQKKQAPWK